MNWKISRCLVVLILIASSSAVGQTRQILINAEPKDKYQYVELLKTDLDIFCAHQDHLKMLVSNEELQSLHRKGVKTEILNPDTLLLQGGGFLDEYMSLAEVETLLTELSTNYPELTELTAIGTSLEGREIYALKISDNASSDEDEAEVLLVGNHHAREVITPMVCMHVARELLEGYGLNPTYTNWVDNREIWIVPVLNPDGFRFVETTNIWWRKNRRDNPGEDEGVDLNRNWGFEWGRNDIGSSGNFASSTYRGEAPFSEPEVDALRQFVLSRDFVIAMSFHSYSDLLLWGPSHRPADGPDQDIFSGIGEIVASQNNYVVGNPNAGTIYFTNGECTDWMYHEAGILAFTPEVGSGQDGFHPSADRIPILIDQGSVCAWEAIRFADRPGRLAPPGQPLFETIPDSSGDYIVAWNPPVEADTEVVEYELVEKTGPSIETDGAENGDQNLELGGWTISDDQSTIGTFSFWGGSADRLNNVCLSKEAYVVKPGDVFSFDAWYQIEADFDYAYAIVSTDGGRSYETLQGTATTMVDPNGRNANHGITGDSKGWRPMSFDLSEYVGQAVWLGFRYNTDRSLSLPGIFIDNVTPVQTWASRTVVASNITSTEFAFSNRPGGEYTYSLRGFDGEGEWGYWSDYVSVTVANQVNVIPESFLVTRGRYASGDLNDIMFSDDGDLRIFRSPTDVQAVTEIEVSATSPMANPSSVTLVVEGSVFARVGVTQAVELFNFASNSWETVDTRQASRFFDESISIAAAGDLSRFVESGSLAMRMRVRHQSSPRQVFSSSIDQLQWFIAK